MSASSNPAPIFLSYAREDIAAARRIAEALRASGIEVWFDETELRGGDSWDANIRKQIKECALFLPIISANTQARAEGYFRLEWKLAERRTDLIGRSKAFLVPVCIDETREAEADVPESFLAVQWTRLPAGETSAAFCARVQKLLGGSALRPGLPTPPQKHSEAPSAGSGDPAPQPTRRRWMLPAITLAILAVLALGVWQPWKERDIKSRSSTAITTAAPTSEVAQLRARLIPDAWKKEDFEPWSAAIDRIIAAEERNADAWALRSIINSLHVIRQFDAGTRPLDVGKSAAARALHLAPDSVLGELAMGMHHTAMISRGGDVNAARSHLRRASTGLPRDSLTRFAELTSFWLGYQFEDTERAAHAWLEAEPAASFPAWILGQMNLSLRNAAGATKWAEKATGDREITGVRALITLFDAHYYLRGNFAELRATLDRIPMGGGSVHRALHSRWLLAMAERRWDVALQELSRTPETIFYDRTFHGPKALLTGLAHQAAGRTDAALAQFSEAERVLREHLAKDGQNEELHAGLAFTLACAGQGAAARGELSLVEPLVRGRRRTVYTGPTMTLLAQTHAALGQVEPMLYWLRELLSGPAVLPFTPASLRLDPRFQSAMGTAEVQALLAEFAHLDAEKPATSSATGEKSLAVLAFENRSSEKDSEYFSDGISEELLNVLAKVPGLKVVGRSSSFQFRGKNEPPQSVGQKLKVTYLVEGSVQRSGTHARIIARLIRADTGEQIWGDGFDSELKDILAAQQDIARVIAEKLSVTFGAAGRPTKAVNPAAHRQVLEGRYFVARRWAGFTAAEKAFSEAAKIDPNFAPAHAGIAEVNMLHGLYVVADGRGPVEDKFARAEVAARRAMELDPTLAEPHATLGLLHFMERDWIQAERHFQQTFRLNPNNGMAYHWHGLLLGVVGKLDRALEALARSVDLDPLGHTSFFTYGRYLCAAGRFAESVEAMDRGLPIATPTATLPVYHSIRAVALHQLGRIDEAVKAARVVRQMPRGANHTPHWWADGDAIYVLQRTGHAQEAEEYLRDVKRNAGAKSHLYGYALCALGRFDEGVPLLADAEPMCQAELYFMPMFESLHGTPRFEAVFAKLNSTAEYKLARETFARLRRAATKE